MRSTCALCGYDRENEAAAEMVAECEADAAAGKYVEGMRGPFWVTVLTQLGAWDEHTTRVCTGPSLAVVTEYLRDGGFDRSWSYGIGPRDGEIRTTLQDGGVVLLPGGALRMATRTCNAQWPQTDETHWDAPPFSPDEEQAVVELLAQVEAP